MQRYRVSLERWFVPLSLVFALACQTDEPPNSPTGPLTELSAAEAPALRFSQLSVDFGGEVHSHSEWGAVDLELPAAGGLVYFNLAVDGVWRIQNVPVQSVTEETGGLATTRFNFDLGVPSGAVVSALSYGFDLTPTPLSQMPQGATPAAVVSADYVLTTCLSGQPIAFTPPNPTLVGGEPAGTSIQRKNFPNQEAGVNECIPVAASNSLQWLNRRYKLGLDPTLISIAAMKTALGWLPTGTPGEWWTRKNKYLSDNQIPISTANVSRTIDDLVKAMKNGCDVELVVGKHAVAVTGVTQQANGNYAVIVANDVDQGKADGRVSEVLTFNTATKTFAGAPWNNGLGIGQLIVECKK